MQMLDNKNIKFAHSHSNFTLHAREHFTSEKCSFLAFEA